MQLLIYKKEFDSVSSIDNFLNLYHSINMPHLASDLLKVGLSPAQISEAVIKALKIAKSSGIEIRKHFMPVLTSMKQEIVTDCKLSKMGYGIVLLNAQPELSIVGEWQVSVMKTQLG